MAEPSGVGFDAADATWVEDPDEALHLLQVAEVDMLGLVDDASNTTVLCRLGAPAPDGAHAVYKPARGERPLWDFPDGSLHRREVAAWAVSDFLGWDLVPPTVLRDGPLGPGSLQMFVPHDPAEHYFTLVTEPRWHEPLVRLGVLDLVTSNADRKGGHILRRHGTDHLYGIDNGLMFHVEPKLRTVVWDLPDVAVPDGVAQDLRLLCADLRGDGPLARLLGRLLVPAEVGVLARRADRVAGLTHLPDLPADARPYPWPPL